MTRADEDEILRFAQDDNSRYQVDSGRHQVDSRRYQDDSGRHQVDSATQPIREINSPRITDTSLTIPDRQCHSTKQRNGGTRQVPGKRQETWVSWGIPMFLDARWSA